MEEHDRSNPIASVEAIVAPEPLTVSQIAILTRVNSPVLFGHIEDLNKCLAAMYLLSLPPSEAVKHVRTAEDDAIAWSEREFPTHADYSRRLSGLLDAITAFWKMMPPSDPKKKASGTETDGSRNSSNGPAGPTDGASAM